MEEVKRRGREGVGPRIVTSSALAQAPVSRRLKTRHPAWRSTGANPHFSAPIFLPPSICDFPETRRAEVTCRARAERRRRRRRVRGQTHSLLPLRLRGLGVFHSRFIGVALTARPELRLRLHGAPTACPCQPPLPSSTALLQMPIISLFPLRSFSFWALWLAGPLGSSSSLPLRPVCSPGPSRSSSVSIFSRCL